jgi:integral membrane protein
MQKESLKRSFRRFRLVGIAEGISFLVLLLIAMPLKYFFDIPEAVKFTGWVHGALFIAFIWFAFDMMGSLKKPFSWFVKAFAAAILPFGTFVFDSKLKKEESALRA